MEALVRLRRSRRGRWAIGVTDGVVASRWWRSHAHDVVAARDGGLGARLRMLARPRRGVLPARRDARARRLAVGCTALPLRRRCGSSLPIGPAGACGTGRIGAGASQALAAISVDALGVPTGAAFLLAAIAGPTGTALWGSLQRAATRKNQERPPPFRILCRHAGRKPSARLDRPPPTNEGAATSVLNTAGRNGIGGLHSRPLPSSS